MRAMTIGGLCLFLGVNSKYINEFEHNLDLEKKQGKDFSNIVSDIRTVIFTQKFEGARDEVLANKRRLRTLINWATEGVQP